MRTDRSTEIKVGAVSLAALIILVLGLVYGKGLTVSSTVAVKMRFPSSGGIQLTSPVLVNGVKRGSVTEIKNDAGSALITAELDNIDDIYSDANARITILEITGGKKVELFPGKSGSKLNPNSEIKGDTPADIADLVAIAGGLINDLGSLVRRADTIASTVNNLTADGKLNAQIKNIASNAEELTANLNSLMKNNMGDINASIKNLKAISSDLRASISKNEPKVAKLVDELDKTINSTQGLLTKAGGSLTKADALIADFQDISKQLKEGKGAVGKLIYDQSFAVKLDSTINSLTDFINMLKMHGVNVNLRLGTRP
jgi:phospholipid/cholesterol/gamma-HCH transport system substrate-binding protein